jgi:hypothetical protein
LTAIQPGDRVLTIQNPYAWLCATGAKPIENRTFHTKFRGRLWIASSLRTDYTWDEGLELSGTRDRLPTLAEAVNGAVLGSVELYDSCTFAELRDKYRHLARSPYAGGPIHWLLRDAAQCAPVPVRGRLGIWIFRESDRKPALPTA